MAGNCKGFKRSEARIKKKNFFFTQRVFNKLAFKINGLEPGRLGASFGLRNCYVRIIITRQYFFCFFSQGFPKNSKALR